MRRRASAGPSADVSHWSGTPVQETVAATLATGAARFTTSLVYARSGNKGSPAEGMPFLECSGVTSFATVPTMTYACAQPRATAVALASASGQDPDDLVAQNTYDAVVNGRKMYVRYQGKQWRVGHPADASSCGPEAGSCLVPVGVFYTIENQAWSPWSVQGGALTSTSAKADGGMDELTVEVDATGRITDLIEVFTGKASDGGLLVSRLTMTLSDFGKQPPASVPR